MRISADAWFIIKIVFWLVLFVAIVAFLVTIVWGVEEHQVQNQSGHLGAGGSDAPMPSAASLCELPTTSARVTTSSLAD